MTKNLKKQLIDQSAHATAAFVFLAPLLAFPNLFTAVFAGAGYGLVREITEEGGKVSFAKFKAVMASRNSKIDIAFWAVGGLVAYLIAG